MFTAIMMYTCCYKIVSSWFLYIVESYHFSEEQASASSKEAQFQGGTGRSKTDTNSTTGICPSTENWLCLECGAVRCSRYASGHGLIHWENTKGPKQNEETPVVGHCVALSPSDLSSWCYVGGAYLHPSMLKPVLDKLEALEFGNEEGKNLEADSWLMEHL